MDRERFSQPENAENGAQIERITSPEVLEVGDTLVDLAGLKPEQKRWEVARVTKTPRGEGLPEDVEVKLVQIDTRPEVVETNLEAILGIVRRTLDETRHEVAANISTAQYDSTRVWEQEIKPRAIAKIDSAVNEMLAGFVRDEKPGGVWQYRDQTRGFDHYALTEQALSSEEVEKLNQSLEKLKSETLLKIQGMVQEMFSDTGYREVAEQALFGWLHRYTELVREFHTDQLDTDVLMGVGRFEDFLEGGYKDAPPTVDKLASVGKSFSKQSQRENVVRKKRESQLKAGKAKWVKELWGSTQARPEAEAEAVGEQNPAPERRSLDQLREQNEARVTEQAIEERLIKIFNTYYPKPNENELHYDQPLRAPDEGMRRSAVGSAGRFFSEPIVKGRGKGFYERRANQAVRAFETAADEHFAKEFEQAKADPTYLDKLEDRLSLTKLLYAEQDLLVLRGSRDPETGKRELDQYQEALRERIGQIKQRGVYTAAHQAELDKLEADLAKEDSLLAGDKVAIEKAQKILTKAEQKYWANTERAYWSEPAGNMTNMRTEAQYWAETLEATQNQIKELARNISHDDWMRNIQLRGEQIQWLRKTDPQHEWTEQEVIGLFEKLEEDAKRVATELKSMSSQDWTGDPNKLAKDFVLKRNAAISAHCQLVRFAEFYLGGAPKTWKGKEFPEEDLREGLATMVTGWQKEKRDWREIDFSISDLYATRAVGIVVLYLLGNMAASSLGNHERLTHVPDSAQTKVVELAQEDAELQTMQERGDSSAELGEYLLRKAVILLAPGLYDKNPIDPMEARLAHEELITAQILLGSDKFDALADEVLPIRSTDQSASETLMRLAAQKVALSELADDKAQFEEQKQSGTAILEAVGKLPVPEQITADQWNNIAGEWDKSLTHYQTLTTPESQLEYLTKVLQPVFQDLRNAYQTMPETVRESDVFLNADWLQDNLGQHKLEARQEKLEREVAIRNEWAKTWLDWEKQVAELDKLETPAEQMQWLQETLRPMADQLTSDYEKLDSNLRYAVAMRLFDKDPNEPGFVWADDELMRRSKEGESTLQQWVDTMEKVIQLKIDRAA